MKVGDKVVILARKGTGDTHAYGKVIRIIWNVDVPYASVSVNYGKRTEVEIYPINKLEVVC